MLRTMICLCVALALLAFTGCDKVKGLNVAGNIAGKIVNPDGSGRGYVGVALMKDGVEVQRQNAEDSGSFFLTKVDGGTYTIQVFSMSGDALPTEPQEIKLGAGKTLQVEVKLLPETPKE